MPRYTTRGIATGKKLTFDWDGDQPPTRKDILRIEGEQLDKELADAEAAAPPPAPRKSYFEMVGDNLKGIAQSIGDWVPMPGGPAIPTPRVLESGRTFAEGLSQAITGDGPEQYPRIAGATKAAKGLFGAIGGPATLAGAALAPIPTAAALGAISFGQPAIRSGIESTIPDAPEEVKDVIDLGSSAALGLGAGYLTAPKTPLPIKPQETGLSTWVRKGQRPGIPPGQRPPSNEGPRPFSGRPYQVFEPPQGLPPGGVNYEATPRTGRVGAAPGRPLLEAPPEGVAPAQSPVRIPPPIEPTITDPYVAWRSQNFRQTPQGLWEDPHSFVNYTEEALRQMYEGNRPAVGRTGVVELDATKPPVPAQTAPVPKPTLGELLTEHNVVRPTAVEPYENAWSGPIPPGMRTIEMEQVFEPTQPGIVPAPKIPLASMLQNKGLEPVQPTGLSTQEFWENAPETRVERQQLYNELFNAEPEPVAPPEPVAQPAPQPPTPQTKAEVQPQPQAEVKPTEVQPEPNRSAPEQKAPTAIDDLVSEALGNRKVETPAPQQQAPPSAPIVETKPAPAPKQEVKPPTSTVDDIVSQALGQVKPMQEAPLAPTKTTPPAKPAPPKGSSVVLDDAMKNKVLDFVKARRIGGVSQIQEKLGLTGDQAQAALTDLEKRGLIAQNGKNWAYKIAEDPKTRQVEPVPKPPQDVKPTKPGPVRPPVPTKQEPAPGPVKSIEPPKKEPNVDRVKAAEQEAADLMKKRQETAQLIKNQIADYESRGLADLAKKKRLAYKRYLKEVGLTDEQLFGTETPKTETKPPASKSSKTKLSPEEIEDIHRRIDELEAVEDKNGGMTANELKEYKELHKRLGFWADESGYSRMGAAIRRIIRGKQPENPSMPDPGSTHKYKGVSAFRSELGSMNRTLRESELPGAQELGRYLPRVEDLKQKFVGTFERKVANITKHFNKADRKKIGQLLDKFENPRTATGYDAQIVEAAAQLRSLLDDIHKMIPTGSRKGGGQTGYIRGYLTHIADLLEGDSMFSGVFKDMMDYHLGPLKAAKNLLTRERLDKATVDAEPGTVGEHGHGKPSSKFVEERVGKIKDIELDVNRILPLYIESVAKVIYDKPAIGKAIKMAAKIPESSAKELADWYIRNYARYDAYPGLENAWNTFTGRLMRVTARSLLGFDTRLFMLHAARAFTNILPELPTKYFMYGTKELFKSPYRNYEEAGRMGLLPNNVRPWTLKRPMEKIDTITNLLGIADYIPDAIAYNGFKKMFRDKGIGEAEASRMAVDATKDASLRVTPARSAKLFTRKLGIVRPYTQFRQQQFKIVEQFIDIFKKRDPAQLARLAVGAGTMMYVAKEMHIATWHLGPYIAKLNGPAYDRIYRALGKLAKGDIEGGATDLALLFTPGGISLSEQLKKGPSMIEEEEGPSTKDAIGAVGPIR